MISFIEKRKSTLTHKMISGFVALTFIFTMIVPPNAAYAQVVTSSVLNLPTPGVMVPLSSGFTPTLVKGITIHPDNPLEFDFIVDDGDDELSEDQRNTEAKKLIKYFMASLTMPENEMWVNLSPYEKDRIIPEDFGKTEMGRDLLAQDYLLKQLASTVMFPENEIGKAFWKRVYEQSLEKYGTTDIPMNTFNKIWIVPEKAKVYVHDSSAFVVNSHLKVMLEEDFVALSKNKGMEKYGLDSISQSDAEVISGVSADVVREILIPEIEKEVNNGKTFANLRQVYNSMILAAWYKINLKNSLLGQVYVNKAKTKGVEHGQNGINRKIYNQYIEAFSKGVYNYIREDYDPISKEVIPRRYFSGGLLSVNPAMVTQETNIVALSAKERNTLPGNGVNRFNVGLLENTDDVAMAVTEVARAKVLAQRITDVAGAETGAVHIDIAVRNGASGTLAGHSEARSNFSRESDTKINKQIKAAHKREMDDIILCIGETAKELGLGLTEEVLEKQIRIALSGLTAAQVAKTIIAYEPRWAIGGSGLGQAADENTAQKMASFIRKTVANLKMKNSVVDTYKRSTQEEIVGSQAAKGVRILYGGSATGDNAKKYLSQRDIDGLLVGGASTSVEKFSPILNAAIEIGVTDGRVPYIGANWKTYDVPADYNDFSELMNDAVRRGIEVGVAPQGPEINRLTRALSRATADAAMTTKTVTGREVTDALLDEEEVALMATNIRSARSYDGIARAAVKVRAIPIFQKAMSELGYTFPQGYSPLNAAEFVREVRDAARRNNLKQYLIKGDHITIKVDNDFLEDKEAQKTVANILLDIMKVKNLELRKARFHAALGNRQYMSAKNKNVRNALNAIKKAYDLVMVEVAAEIDIFALDASFMPMQLNILATAFLDQFAPESASHEGEVGEIGGSNNSTVAEAVEFITGVVYKSEEVKDGDGNVLYVGLAEDANGNFIEESRGKGLVAYGVELDRLAINNGTSHGNNYDPKTGELIVTKMNLALTKAIVDALEKLGHKIKIVQHGITGTPLENLPKLRAAGITSGHVGTNWQNIAWETLVGLKDESPVVAGLVNRMIDDLIQRSGEKYEVKSRETADAGNLERLIGKELKNLWGKYRDEVDELPGWVLREIDDATEESAIAHFNAFGAAGTLDMVEAYVAAKTDAAMTAKTTFAGGTIINSLSEAAVEQEATRKMLSEIEKELTTAGTGKLPHIMVASDYHGEIDLFLQYIADAISQRIDKNVTLDHDMFPQVSIEEQLKKQGVAIKTVDLSFYLLGDFPDRGKNAVKCYMVAKELIELGVAKYVTGNHDLWNFLNVMGFHLPVYEGYNFYGNTTSEKLVQEHWNDAEIQEDRIGWWTARLAEYNKAQKDLQGRIFNGKASDVRAKFKEHFLEISDQLESEEKVLWEDLVGYYFGSTNVYTGLNAVGMMSNQWWQERVAKLHRLIQTARGTKSADEIAIMRELLEYVEEASAAVSESLCSLP